MGGLKIIPVFLILILMTYSGMQFVEANREEVTITLGSWHSEPMAQGFVVLTAALCGMLFCGLLCSIELLGLYVQNRRLKRRIETLKTTQKIEKPAATDLQPRTQGRFT